MAHPQPSTKSKSPSVLSPTPVNSASSLHSAGISGQVAMAQVTAQIHQGPLPAPSDLAQYEQACKGAADRIIQMAERQSAHRQELEKIVVTNGAKNATRGLLAAWSIGILGILSGAWLLSLGKSIEGFGTIILNIGTLVGIFIYGKRTSQKELERKRQA